MVHCELLINGTYHCRPKFSVRENPPSLFCWKLMYRSICTYSRQDAVNNFGRFNNTLRLVKKFTFAIIIWITFHNVKFNLKSVVLHIYVWYLMYFCKTNLTKVYKRAGGAQLRRLWWKSWLSFFLEKDCSEGSNWKYK